MNLYRAAAGLCIVARCVSSQLPCAAVVEYAVECAAAAVVDEDARDLARDALARPGDGQRAAGFPSRVAGEWRVSLSVPAVASPSRAVAAPPIDAHAPSRVQRPPPSVDASPFRVAEVGDVRAPSPALVAQTDARVRCACLFLAVARDGAPAAEDPSRAADAVAPRYVPTAAVPSHDAYDPPSREGEQDRVPDRGRADDAPPRPQPPVYVQSASPCDVVPATVSLGRETAGCRSNGRQPSGDPPSSCRDLRGRRCPMQPDDRVDVAPEDWVVALLHLPDLKRLPSPVEVADNAFASADCASE